MNKRDNGILALLSEHGRMEVAVLARQLGVSAVTMRKDLDALERRGVVRREHGFAVFGGNDDLKSRFGSLMRDTLKTETGDLKGDAGDVVLIGSLDEPEAPEEAAGEAEAMPEEVGEAAEAAEETP